MSQRDPIRVFVSHGYVENDDYVRVFEYLESARNFYYRNCSRPDLAPADGSVEGVREDLRRQIAQAEVVIALESFYHQHREQLLFELNYAKASDRPVLLLQQFGREAPVPKALEGLIDETVGWDERALVDAIRRHARHEETTRWDTIEFKLD